MDKIELFDWPDMDRIYQNNYMEPYVYSLKATPDNLLFLADKINELIDLVQAEQEQTT